MYDINMVEGTTRYVTLNCKHKEDGSNFDFTDYSAQTYFKPKHGTEMYLPTAIVQNILSFSIPANATINISSGIIETRIFKNDEVVSVIIANVNIFQSPKPNLEPVIEGE